MKDQAKVRDQYPKISGVGIYSEILSSTCTIKKNDKFKLNNSDTIILIKDIGYTINDAYYLEIPIDESNKYYIITSAQHYIVFKENDILYKIKD